MANALPDEIVQSIAISNAKSIGEQPAILANMALANQVLNNNLQQQMAISQQNAMNQVILATMSKCVALITGDGESGNGSDPSGGGKKPHDSMDMLTNMQKMFEQCQNGEVPSVVPTAAPTANPSQTSASPTSPRDTRDPEAAPSPDEQSSCEDSAEN